MLGRGRGRGHLQSAAGEEASAQLYKEPLQPSFCSGPGQSHLFPAGKLSWVRVWEVHITRLDNNTGQLGSVPAGGPHSFVDLSEQHF